MINSSYSSQQLSSLFGRQDAVSSVSGRASAQTATKVMVKLIEQAQKADPQLAQATAGQGVGAGLPIVPPDGYVIESVESLEARYRTAVEAMAKYEAGEAAFEAENGFRRQANVTAVNSYNAAMSGQVYAVPQASLDDAAYFAERIVSSVTQHLTYNNIDTRALADPAQIQATAESKGLTTEQASAFLKDRRDASQMWGVFEAAVLAKTFEVTGGSNSIIEKHEGTYRLANAELRYEGKLVLSIEGHGDSITRYDEAGRAISVIGMHASEAGRLGTPLEANVS